jgi:precorrin-6A/cobalt-precorrin-6A reductase
MRILLLGGTGEALALARELPSTDIYSLAGLGRVPDDLICTVRVGGFGGADGLAQFVRDEHIGLIVDATHPYAAQISSNAAVAAQRCAIPYWALRRPGWQAQDGDQWIEVDGWDELMRRLADFKRPFFTLGREPLAHLDAIPPTQHWTIRCLTAEPGSERAHVIGARGPFELHAERALFAERGFDVLVSKNSGGEATEPKLQVARERGVPVLILKRPQLPPATREFATLAELVQAVREA